MKQFLNYIGAFFLAVPLYRGYLLTKNTPDLESTIAFLSIIFLIGMFILIKNNSKK